ncbi:hypothetical protein GCM10023231_24700 [Olivibacter ginsenosidimutans]|uniref:Uncharacterized protein n=1 Tax=Olivibacter ginsenosidimutans TaxID=1176537 RepID=A0ABP9BGK5_9SPHI
MGHILKPATISGKSLKLQYDTVVTLDAPMSALKSKRQTINLSKRTSDDLKSSRCSAYAYLVP